MTDITIPLVDLSRQYEKIGPALEAAVVRVLRSGRYVKGAEVESFESAWSGYIGPGVETVAVSSGTSALEIALRAHGIGPGDAVAVPAMTFAATAEAVANVGAEPVFVDVKHDGTMDPDRLRGLARDVSAVIPVHLYGRTADMENIESFAKEKSAVVIEDAAQAHGGRYSKRAPVGSRGNTCAWSFYPGKNLGAVGDAGAITTHDSEVADLARSLRDHGRWGKYTHALVGTNARMSEIQAAALYLKFPFLNRWRKKRYLAAGRYRGLLSATNSTDHVELPEFQPGHAWHLYVVRVKGGLRNAVRAKMRERGIGVGTHYPVALPDQPAFENHASIFPEARRLARECLSLPLFPEIKGREQRRVAYALRNSIKELNK